MIIQMNIDRYQEMLARDLGAEERCRVEQLFADADHRLAQASTSKNR